MIINRLGTQTFPSFIMRIAKESKSLRPTTFHFAKDFSTALFACIDLAVILTSDERDIERTLM